MRNKEPKLNLDAPKGAPNKISFKRSALPQAYPGQSFIGVIDQVVPDQSMSLEEILIRFTRGEPLPVGMEVEDGDDSDNPLNIDLEKLATSDLVDKEEFIQKLREVQKKYDKQEAERLEAERKRKEEEFRKLDEKRIRIAARKLAKENAAKSA